MVMRGCCGRPRVTLLCFADSEWTTVPVFAKKDGGLRWAIDFRGLNAQLAGDKYSMPFMDDVLNALGSAAICSTFDISFGFWGLSVRKHDQKYLAFHSRYKGVWELFTWKRCPFGLLDATADFSRCYQMTLGPASRCARDSLGIISLVWVDDNVVYSKETYCHLNDVCQVLQRLAANNMSIKPSKCI